MTVDCPGTDLRVWGGPGQGKPRDSAQASCVGTKQAIREPAKSKARTTKLHTVCTRNAFDFAVLEKGGYAGGGGGGGGEGEGLGGDGRERACKVLARAIRSCYAVSGTYLRYADTRPVLTARMWYALLGTDREGVWEEKRGGHESEVSQLCSYANRSIYASTDVVGL
eukprot:1679181-Rhodomonas_salina.2